MTLINKQNQTITGPWLRKKLRQVKWGNQKQSKENFGGFYMTFATSNKMFST